MITAETYTEETSPLVDVEAPRSKPTVVWVLIVLGTVVMVLSTLNSWVERRLLDTESWVETSTALLDDDEVRHEVSVRLVNRLYENVDVGTAIDENLPADLQGLGDPLAGLLRGPLVDTADTLLASGPVRATWKEANRTAHEAVVAILEDDVGDIISTSDGKVVIDLRDLLGQVGEQIGLPQDVLDAIPEDAGLFEVVESDNLETAQTAVTLIKILSVITFLLVVIFYGSAVYLADNWRREAIHIVGLATALGGFVVLVVVRLVVNVVGGTAETPGGRAALDSILAIGTALLRQLGWSEIIIGLLIALGTSLLGPAGYAKRARHYTAQGFRRAAVATWIGFALVVLVVLAWTPFTAAGDWAMVLIVLILVVVGIEAIRRTSLAEDATRLEEEAAAQQAAADRADVAVPADSGADAT